MQSRRTVQKNSTAFSPKNNTEFLPATTDDTVFTGATCRIDAAIVICVLYSVFCVSSGCFDSLIGECDTHRADKLFLPIGLRLINRPRRLYFPIPFANFYFASSEKPLDGCGVVWIMDLLQVKFLACEANLLELDPISFKV